MRNSLIADLVDGGMAEDAAADAVKRIVEAMRARLSEGRSVTLPGIGYFTAPAKVVRVTPTEVSNKRRVKVTGEVVSASEKYVPSAPIKKRGADFWK